MLPCSVVAPQKSPETEMKRLCSRVARGILGGPTSRFSLDPFGGLRLFAALACSVVPDFGFAQNAGSSGQTPAQPSSLAQTPSGQQPQSRPQLTSRRSQRVIP